MSARIPDDRIREMQERVEKATPGPWTTTKPTRDEDGFAKGVAVAGTPGRQIIYAHPPGGSYPYNDCNFIAHARTDLADLLRERKDLLAERGRLSEHLRQCLAFAAEIVAGEHDTGTTPQVKRAKELLKWQAEQQSVAAQEPRPKEERRP
jgi:hypothetical protein